MHTSSELQAPCVGDFPVLLGIANLDGVRGHVSDEALELLRHLKLAIPSEDAYRMGRYDG